MQQEPFTISIAQTILDDVTKRLERVRWPDEVEGAEWDYGANREYMRELVDYWRNTFDWRAEEARLNQWHHYRVLLDDMQIHFIHERGRGPNPLPLIITHGWPGSFVEMLKLLPLLIDPAAHGGDPEDAFDVILPSLPGFGFSDRPVRQGITNMQIADLWKRLMVDVLGYPHFGAGGGDIGSGVTQRLALMYPDRLIGMHLTYLGSALSSLDPQGLSEAERHYLHEVERWSAKEGAYSHLHATRPQTLAYALNDSPAGLAAWIVEKFRAWSDCEGEVERRFSKDELLTNIMLYWVTETISSSMRLYFENARNLSPLQSGQHIEVPTAFALFPKEINQPPREWAERTLRLQRWTQMPRGGHFAAMEEPALLAEDLRAFFRPLRTHNVTKQTL
ncbi:epoxide hydrolase family protein [Dictyobacter aurantiacus]|uniref:Multidrug MFS transporter n=1 Tax=Dictyobacter aurantiacus TaxID=1936993 RepID=A0A401Z9F3_9CHLR|nr:epoxide hydrolase family protein [Dictyobacter aurantiacus]GCE03469.1 multidrug MFS transporter [Dictyobacter aurantiacus]